MIESREDWLAEAGTVFEVACPLCGSLLHVTIVSAKESTRGHVRGLVQRHLSNKHEELSLRERSLLADRIVEELQYGGAGGGAIASPAARLDYSPEEEEGG